MKLPVANWPRSPLVFLLAIRAFAGDVTFLPVSPFGRPLSGCTVESFRAVEGQLVERHDYQSHFSGLSAHQIPVGTYDASVKCDKTVIERRLSVSVPNQLEVVATREDLLAFDHGKAKLTVKVIDLPRDGKTWWIRLIGVYNNKVYMDRFDPETAVATVARPNSGRYIVTVLSTGGYSCIREVDLATFSKLWIFQRSDCSFKFDEFASTVHETDRDPSKPGRIESDIQRQWREILHSLPNQ